MWERGVRTWGGDRKGRGNVRRAGMERWGKEHREIEQEMGESWRRV